MYVCLCMYVYVCMYVCMCVFMSVCVVADPGGGGFGGLRPPHLTPELSQRLVKTLVKCVRVPL